MTYPYYYLGPSFYISALYNELTMKKINKTGVGMSDWCYWSKYSPDGGIQWLVASSEALDLLHWALPTVTYRCIAMAIRMTSKVDVFFFIVVVCNAPWWPSGQYGATSCPMAHPEASDSPWTCCIRYCVWHYTHASAWPQRLGNTHYMSTTRILQWSLCGQKGSRRNVKCLS